MSVEREITIDGTTLTVAAWAARLGCNVTTIYRRLRRGMAEREAVTTPPTHRHFARPAGLNVTLPYVRRRLSRLERRVRDCATAIAAVLEDLRQASVACSAAGCWRAVYTRGLCRVHHAERDTVLGAGIEIDGERHSVKEWARRTGVSEKTIHRRIALGWTPSAAVHTAPVSPEEAARKRWGRARS